MAHDKYTRRQKYISTDGGLTFNPVTPPEYIKGELIETDSIDCGAEVITWVPVEGVYICELSVPAQYRWVTLPGQYSCVGYNKMNKEKEQVSYNSGVSWEDTGNTRAGSTLIEANSTDCGYVPTPYSTQYLTTEALGDGNISLNRVAPGSSRPLLGIQYSKNDGDWESYTYDTNISVVTGDKIRWKGTKNVNNYNELYSYFRATADYKAYGNPLSLLKSDSFVDEPDTIYEYAYYKLFTNNRTLRDASGLALPATTLAKYCYYYMFQGCTKLTTAPVLPATTLADHCYYEMFWNCISLTTAPALPATTLARYCYDEMFYNCTRLTTAPVLPATTLADGCYISMFQQCTSLTTAPALPATTLSYMCYSKMFYKCTSLTTAPELPATTLAQQCYNQMFSSCTSLTSAPALPAATLANHCCSQMFWNCTSLTTAPALPSTTLADGCYYEMFAGCTGLTTAPELPAETLVSECYRGMFDGCTSLNYIKCCATNISANLCTYFWARNVASTGTFVKNVSMTSWTTGISGIPSGWTTDTCDCEPAHDYSTEYLTTEALSSGNIRLKKQGSDKEPITDIQYSKNGSAWESYTYNTNIAVVTGDKIRWKATIKDGNSHYNNYSVFLATADYKAYGNPLSLLNNDNFINKPDAIYDDAYANLFYVCDNLRDASGLALPATTLAKDCYYCMFDSCSNLTTAPVLPATTLADSCYKYMFRSCTSLTTAPELPATTLAPNCYEDMFYDCTGLTAAPALPATTLAGACYEDMFYDCTGLTTAPELPATTLASLCYHSMFAGCTSLTTAPELPVTTLANYCYDNMFAGCTGLTTAPELPATTLADNCYNAMFYNCTNLTTAPELPATTLAKGCYDSMFGLCTSLTTAPELPATTLAADCYNGMFYNCRSLTTAPELPATRLAGSCYRGMFEGCTSLNYIKCLATDLYSFGATYAWVAAVASTGTFVKASSMTGWTTGYNGIPSGWTVQDA